MWQVIINDRFRFIIKADKIGFIHETSYRGIEVFIGADRFYIPLIGNNHATIVPPAEDAGLVEWPTTVPLEELEAVRVRSEAA